LDCGVNPLFMSKMATIRYATNVQLEAKFMLWYQCTITSTL